MTPSRILLASSLLALSTAACGSDLDGSFSDVSLEERDRAIQTAMGAPVVAAGFLVFFADFGTVGDSPCLERIEDGDTMTLRAVDGAACTATDSRFGGQVTVRGWDDFTDEDLEDSISMNLESFSMLDDDGDELMADGTIEVEQAADGSGTTVVDVSAEIGGEIFQLSAALECDPEPGTCRYLNASGSTSALEFEIRGTYRDGTGVLELVGDQHMIIDFDRAADDCAPVTIDGEPAADFCKRAADE